MVDADPREQRIAAQRSKLLEVQRKHSGLLIESGITTRAIEVARRLNGNHWQGSYEEVTPDTRFVVHKSGLVIGKKSPGIEHLHIAKFEGDNKLWQWSEKVGERYREKHSEFSVAPGFDPNDFRLVADFVDDLDTLKASGELSGLNFDLLEIK